MLDRLECLGETHLYLDSDGKGGDTPAAQEGASTEGSDLYPAAVKTF